MDKQIFHDRLGHISFPRLKYVPGSDNVDVLDSFYDTCKLAKFHKLPFQSSDSKTDAIFDLLHMDLWGPFPIASLNGERYFYTIVDDFSRATWTYLIHDKVQVLDIVKSFMSMVKTQFSVTPKKVRSDNGTELVNTKCSQLLSELGIIHQRTMPYCPQQNGVVERKHRHLVETARALRLHANLPKQFWGD